MPKHKKSHKKAHKKSHKKVHKKSHNKSYMKIKKLTNQNTKKKLKKLKKKLKKTQKETIEVLSETVKPLIDINPIVQASTQEIQQVLEEEPIDESKLVQLDKKLESVNEMVTQAIETIQVAQAQPINPAIINLSESLQIYIQCHGGCLTQNFGVPSNLILSKKNDCSIGYENTQVQTDEHLSKSKKHFEDTVSLSTCDITSCYPMPYDIIKAHHDAIDYTKHLIKLQEEIKRKCIPFSSQYLIAEHLITSYSKMIAKINYLLKNTQSDFCRYKIDIKVITDKIFNMHHSNSIYFVDSGIFLRIPRLSKKLYNLFLASDIHEINVLLGRNISMHLNARGKIIECTFTDGTKKMAYDNIFLDSVLRTCADIAHYAYHDKTPLPVLMLDHSCFVFDKTVDRKTIDEYKMRGLHDPTFFYGGK
jgi:hypothetical protein